MFGCLGSVIFKETSVLFVALRKNADFFSVFSDVVRACTMRDYSYRAEREENICSQGVRSISVNTE